MNKSAFKELAFDKRETKRKSNGTDAGEIHID